MNQHQATHRQNKYQETLAAAYKQGLEDGYQSCEINPYKRSDYRDAWERGYAEGAKAIEGVLRDLSKAAR